MPGAGESKCCYIDRSSSNRAAYADYLTIFFSHGNMAQLIDVQLTRLRTTLPLSKLSAVECVQRDYLVGRPI